MSFVHFISLSLFAFVSLAVSSGIAASSYEFSGKALHRIYRYDVKKNPSGGLDSWVQMQEKIEWSRNFNLVAQLYGYSGGSKVDLFQDFDGTNESNLVSEIWAGDVYLQGTSDHILLRLGYQQIPWQEGVGLSFTNFINARDNRTSPFDQPDLTYRSAPAANIIISGDSLSAQLVYIPFSQYDISMPVSRSAYANKLMAAFQTVRLDPPTSDKWEHVGELGGRITWAGEGYDLSVFRFRLKDRKLVYEVSPQSTFSNLILIGEHEKKDVYGFTSTFDVSGFLLRMEYLEYVSREWNTVSNANVGKVKTNDSAITLAIDSPIWTKISFSFQHSISILAKDFDDLERKRVESITYGSFDYRAKADNTFRLQAVHLGSDQTLMGRVSYKWPALRTAEFELGYEFSAGEQESVGGAQKNLRKAYIDLSHVF